MPGSAFLRGERVTLRTVEEEDVDFLCDLVNDPDVWPYLKTTRRGTASPNASSSRKG